MTFNLTCTVCTRLRQRLQHCRHCVTFLACLDRARPLFAWGRDRHTHVDPTIPRTRQRLYLASKMTAQHKQEISVLAAKTKVIGSIAYSVCLLISLGIVFRPQIVSQFDFLFGDRYDGMIELAILEHWFNVWKGLSSWHTTFYFFPYKGTLGYNEGFFLFGIPYSVFRSFGIEPFLSSELVNIVLRGLAFVAFHAFLRRALLVTPGLSLLGSVLFTISCTTILAAGHAQLLSIGFVPLFGLIIWSAAQALKAGRSKNFIQHGSMAAVFMGSWLLTSFYMAWFTLFFMSFYSLLGIIFNLRSGLFFIKALSKQSWFGLMAVTMVSAISVWPFLWLYLPKAETTGMHPFSDALDYTTQPLDLIHVGPGNLLLSRLDGILNSYFRPEMPRFSEHTTGLTPLLLLIFAFACGSLWTGSLKTPTRIPLLLGTAAVVTWLLTIRIGGQTPWLAIYKFIPGAKGLRVVVRYQLFLAAPIIGVTVWYLARKLFCAPTSLGIIISVALVTEQLTVEQPVRLDRRAELVELRSIPSPPSACHSFFVSHARAGRYFSPELDRIYSHNVDGMFLAEWFRIPTINGFNTFEPPDWNFAAPEENDYLTRVHAYLEAHRLTDICSLDLLTKTWTNPPQATGRLRQ